LQKTRQGGSSNLFDAKVMIITGGREQRKNKLFKAIITLHGLLRHEHPSCSPYGEGSKEDVRGNPMRQKPFTAC